MLNLLKKWNTLRNQILFVFLFVMFIVLVIVSILTFHQVSSLLKKNAETQIQQVAIEASGKMESLYEQINMASKLVTTNDKVQKMLTRKYQKKPVAFSELQELMSTVNTITANSDGIFSFQLFAHDQKRVLPLDEASLQPRLDKSWIKKADKAKGKFVWIGQDPNDSNYFLAIRRVNLMDQSYANGGYLLISIYHNYFQFANQDFSKEATQYSILLDKSGNSIISNYQHSIVPIVNNQDSIIQINKRDYMVTKHSSNVTGWSVLILTPVSALTEGITVLRSIILISGIIGLVIYFISSLFLSNIITKPILRLTKTMQCASEGSLSLNPNVSSVNEINKLNSTYNQLVKETNHLITMVYQKEIIRSRSELKALQAQINPHFLFNTLDALHWALEDKNEEELAELVVAMSNLFRYTITNQNEDEWVFIKEEIKHIDDYMEIMKMRFGEQLKWEITLPPQFEYVKIPKFLIQPLVENSVLHGAGNKLDQCKISIKIEAKDVSRIKIIVQDDGLGIEKEKLEEIMASLEKGKIASKSGKGMAIANVYKRLKLYYKEEQQGLVIKSELNQGTLISFDIPIDGGEW
ncbi:sensor histidine kinase [Niallia sp. NCCP-28]|uniref:sensor histidine kinase n=1 Tax=Niallia sp. NCCP-28 TaxID=2934712 RepID=UPI0020861F6C|nr:sensor histidine kinase [Niallia sp. NCCP-28]GKU81866.1 histidine kinase [Niallia sp. NCCP-28]